MYAVIVVVIIHMSLGQATPSLFVGLYNTTTVSCPQGFSNSTPSSTYSAASVLTFTVDENQHFVSSAVGLNVSWIVRHPSLPGMMYAVSEVCWYENTPAGSIAVLQLETDGRITVVQRVSSKGRGPVFLSAHPSGRFLFVANYFSGDIAVIRIDAHGRLGIASDRHSQGIGSHSIYCRGEHVFSCVLGEDKVTQWRFDDKTGTLTPNPSAAALVLPQGTGPRHLAFHPTAPIVVIVNEGNATVAATIIVCARDADAGTLRVLDTVSAIQKTTHPSGMYPSEGVFSADGLFLYVSVRDATTQGRDSIAIFDVDSSSAKVTLKHNQPTGGWYPRSIALTSSVHSPNGVLVAGNQKGKSVTKFLVGKDGLLAPFQSPISTSDAVALVCIL